MKSIVRHGVVASGAAVLLAGCASGGDYRTDTASTRPAAQSGSALVADVPVTLGAAYKVDGVTHTPVDVADYDAVGYAGVYGDAMAGRPTANGETFDPAAISASHKTLPLPSYVEVTALDTGRTILLRINDRGPMANDRLIDLSPGAAAQLGIEGGTAVAVRVRRTNPPAAERAQLRAGKAVPERIATPQSLLSILRTKAGALPKPKSAPPAKASIEPVAPIATGKAKPGDDRFVVERPAAKPAQPSAAPPAGASLEVQVAAFSSEANAKRTAALVGGNVSKAGTLWRVRMGPYATRAEADKALALARDKGFRDAVIVGNR